MQLVNHKFRLRREVATKLRLPVDITDREANRLADFIKTIVK